ncbi:hypothetical protein [Muricomes intestini]|jgi:peptidoglycan hydrolase CwlO-like protein|uniref:hypothetical protein n=1 Tax=Muricomes intestini TaxID=1796634 RepID=UPI002FDFCEF4
MDNEELLRTLQGMFEKNVQEVKRYTGVKVEDLQRQVKAVAEGHSLLNEKIDRLDRKVDGLDRRVDGLDKKVDSLAGKVNSLEGRMGKLETDMKEVKQDLSTIKGYVIAVDDKLNKHDVILKRIK